MAGNKVLMQGNVAMCEGAVQAGCRFFAGYPITPQNEVPEYMSERMPQVGGTFIQAEAEVAAINMIFGASAVGARCMTSSSSPGVSLKQEGISYIAAGELPCVIANVQRAGPGLGGIRGAQGDYFQSVKGGGHGDYKLLVFTPASVQETYDMAMVAFDWADHYRNPAMILTDGIVGQMSEPVDVRPYEPVCELPEKDWILDGCKGRKPRVVKTLHLHPPESLMDHNRHLVEKYAKIEAELQMAEEYLCDDAEVIVTAYGATARMAKAAVNMARDAGMNVGLLRPKMVWPFPVKFFAKHLVHVRKWLVVEMSNGQFIEDVKLATECRKPVEFFGCGGGWYPTGELILEKLRQVYI
jgi:2-oxoglutarate/2-oxoacid ferredoxin oxidoreductase subunit alpha